jgi:hypothetical protein
MESPRGAKAALHFRGSMWAFHSSKINAAWNVTNARHQIQIVACAFSAAKSQTPEVVIHDYLHAAYGSIHL